MIVYLARVIPAFVMYCVNGESGSSLLIESTHRVYRLYDMKHVYKKHVKRFKLACIREKKNTQLLFQAVGGNESERRPAGRESRDRYKRVAGHPDKINKLYQNDGDKI